MNKIVIQSLSQTHRQRGFTSSRRIARLDNLARRVLDICVSLTGILLFSPFLLLIIILLKRDSRGPVFYRGLRVGKNGRNFHMLKFRTMYEHPESHQGPEVTAADDPRVTPVGRWLRDTKLNELPQLWNVLKGEMSIVGPRPEVPMIVSQWPEEVQQELLFVRPGVTSPASVVYRDEEALLKTKNVMEDYMHVILPSKLRFDQLYVRNRSLLTDLDVIFWTLIALFPQLRQKRIPEHLLYWGPLARFISRYFNWFVIDNLVAFCATIITGLIWRSGGPLDLGIEKAIGIAVTIAMIFSLVNAILGLNRIAWSRASPSEALSLAFSNGLATFVLMMVNRFWLPEPRFPSGMLLVTGLLTFLGFMAARYRSRLITGMATRWVRLRGETLGAIGERVLIVGAGEAGQFAAWLLRKWDFAQALSIVGMVDDDPRKQGMQIDGCKVIGRIKDIPALVEQHDIGLALFAIAKITPEDQERILTLCRETLEHVVIVPDILQLIRAQFPFTDDAAGIGSGSADQIPLAFRGLSIHPSVVGTWLNELESLGQTKDWFAQKARIQEMRASLGLITHSSASRPDQFKMDFWEDLPSQ